jgi:hypothetical protein
MNWNYIASKMMLVGVIPYKIINVYTTNTENLTEIIRVHFE